MSWLSDRETPIDGIRDDDTMRRKKLDPDNVCEDRVGRRWSVMACCCVSFSTTVDVAGAAPQTDWSPG